MAKARKLPSGAYRCRPTMVINGKKVTMSFTVHPDECGGDGKKAKALAEKMAREWTLNQTRVDSGSLKVYEAMERYIEDRSKIISPATVKTYAGYIKFFDSIKDMYVTDVDTPTVQRLINDMSVDLKRKTIRNYIGFLLSVLDYCGNEKKFKLRYPQQAKREQTTPDRDDVYQLIDNSSDYFKPMVCLAAFGTMRRGEICALKQKDVSRDMRMISIHADMVQDKEKQWIYKPMPKTSDSVRSVVLPADIIALIPVSDDPEEFIFKLTPDAITRRFERLRKKLGLTHVRFHDLRHYAASFRSDLGIPRKYIEEDGGWSGDSRILQNVYDNPLKSAKKKYIRMVNDYIEDNFSDAIKKKKSG